MIDRRYALLLTVLGAVLLVSCVVSLGFGPARVPVEVVWRILLHKAFGVGDVSWSAGQEALRGTASAPSGTGRSAPARRHFRRDVGRGDRGATHW